MPRDGEVFACMILEQLELAPIRALGELEQLSILDQAKTELLAEFPSWSSDDNWDSSFRRIALRDRMIAIAKRRAQSPRKPLASALPRPQCDCG